MSTGKQHNADQVATEQRGNSARGQKRLDQILPAKGESEKQNKKPRTEVDQTEGKTAEDLEASPAQVNVGEAVEKKPYPDQTPKTETPASETHKGSLEGVTEHEAMQEQPTASKTPSGNVGCVPPEFPTAGYNILEQGRIYFFYRPKVSVTEVKSLDDVQRFLMVMCPTSRPEAPARLVIIGKKHLPSPEKHERFFAFVEAVGKSVDELVGGLGEEHYETKTRGERVQPAAHTLGEALYIISRHQTGSRSHTHLAYKLEVPAVPGVVQREFNLNEAGSFSLSVKNPSNKPPGRPSAGPEAQYSEEQQKEFQDYAWISAEDPSLLDVAGSELLLVGSRKGLSQEHGETRLDRAVEQDTEDRAGGVEKLEEELKGMVGRAGGAVVGSEVEKGTF